VRQLQQGEKDLLGRLVSIQGAEVGLFEVTAVQLEKSIVDANFSIQAAFATTGFHYYEAQPQGEDHKVVVDLALLTSSGLVETKMSMYRPDTKGGDPRLWIYRLTSLCPEVRPGDVIAIVQDGTSCTALNLSDPRASASEDDLTLRDRSASEPAVIAEVKRRSPSRGDIASDLDPAETAQSRFSEVQGLFPAGPTGATGVAVELLDRLRMIASAGPILSERRGDTAVGYAVETALGIKANSSKRPDYKGIEIKSGKSIRGNSNKTLFAKMFDRDMSPVGSYAGLLDKCGYFKEDGLKYLQCSVDGRAPNPQALVLSVDYQDGLLREKWGPLDSAELVAVWELARLQEDLANKHRETFWVEATEVQMPEGRGFAVSKVLHTSTPRLSAFTHLLSDGTVFVDHTIRQKPEGGTRDHGMLFRTKAKHLARLFKVEGEYALI
jgi:hypothetical protein